MDRKIKFDKEYATSWDKEVSYLKNKGILSTFVKTGETGIRTYKYTKNVRLFEALADFYKALN